MRTDDGVFLAGCLGMIGLWLAYVLAVIAIVVGLAVVLWRFIFGAA